MRNNKSSVRYKKNGQWLEKKVNYFSREKILTEIFGVFPGGKWRDRYCCLEEDIEEVYFRNFTFDQKGFMCRDNQKLVFENCFFNVNNLSLEFGNVQIINSKFKRMCEIDGKKLVNFRLEFDFAGEPEYIYIVIRDTDCVYFKGITGDSAIKTRECGHVIGRELGDLWRLDLEAEEIELRDSREMELMSFGGISLCSEQLILDNVWAKSNGVLIECQDCFGQNFTLISNNLIKVNETKYLKRRDENWAVVTDLELRDWCLREKRRRLISDLKGINKLLVSEMEEKIKSMTSELIEEFSNEEIAKYYTRRKKK